MATCKIYGTIQHGDGNVAEGLLIYAVPVAIPTIVGTSAVSPYPVETISTSTGYFEMELLQEVEFRIIINAIGFKQVIKIPVADEYLLWSLTAVQSTGGTNEPEEW